MWRRKAHERSPAAYAVMRMARMLETGDRFKELRDFGAAQDDRELHLLLGRDHAFHNPGLAERHAIEKKDGKPPS